MLGFLLCTLALGADHCLRSAGESGGRCPAVRWGPRRARGRPGQRGGGEKRRPGKEPRARRRTGGRDGTGRIARFSPACAASPRVRACATWASMRGSRPIPSPSPCTAGRWGAQSCSGRTPVPCPSFYFHASRYLSRSSPEPRCHLVRGQALTSRRVLATTARLFCPLKHALVPRAGRRQDPPSPR